MKYYAYKPDKQGKEPMGTSNKLLFELKTHAGAIRRARRILGDVFRVFVYWNFYNDKTFTQIYPKSLQDQTLDELYDKCRGSSTSVEKV